MIQAATFNSLVDRMTASYWLRMDSNSRTRYCGWEEAERIVGKNELMELLQNGKIEYIKPRTDCAQNAKWKIRRLHCFMHVKPVADSTQKISETILANNI